MPVVKIKVWGDHWINQTEVLTQLAGLTDAKIIVLDLCAEGPSLDALGISRCLLDFCNSTDRDPKTLVIENWHNAIESVAFTRAFTPKISHFFWLSNTYRQHVPAPAPLQFLMAFFVGRATMERSVMLWQLHKILDDKILLSLMRGHHHDILKIHSINEIHDYLDPEQLTDYSNWWTRPCIDSLDGHHTRDQYDQTQNTNRDLLQFYNKFNVEIVAETYTKGITFFPTEKTVRPLSQNKALIVFGPRHYLKHLRKLGFQTWHQIWDESYDELEGAARWKAMLDIILELYQRPRDSLLAELDAVAKHNRQKLDFVINRYRPQ